MMSRVTLDAERRAEPDLVVLLDGDRRPVGTMTKAEVHGANTPLHLAFSVYVFDAEGRLLVTRRALSKLTWPGVWTNSCCGHVRPDETPAQAAVRRLREELSLEVHDLTPALPDFAYRAVSAEGVVENEVCPVFTARTDAAPVADPEEVAEWTWASWSAFRDTAARAPWLVSPWSAEQAVLLPADVG